MTTSQVNTVAELIAAISNANVSTIVLQSGQLYELSQTWGEADDNGISGLPPIDRALTIIGNGAVLQRDASAPSFRFFRVESDGDLTLQSLTLRGGSLLGLTGTLGFHGAAIRNDGTLTAIQCVFSDNQNKMTDGYGGAILNTAAGVVTLENCQLLNNQSAHGGAILSEGDLTVTDCIISQNSGVFSGGLDGSGSAEITGTEISANVAQDAGALRWSTGSLTVTHCDITRNRANNSGACLFAHDVTQSLQTIVLHHNRIFGNYSLETDFNKRDVFRNVESGSTPPDPAYYVDARFNWWGSSDGPSGEAGGLGDSVGNYVDYMPYVEADECLHEGICDCAINYAATDCFSSDNPISLRHGEKRVEATDLVVNTPAGPLTFTRFFRQTKLDDPAFQVLGRGWTHIHDVQLDDPGNQQAITVVTPKGGKVVFDWDQSASYYRAAPGSSATLVVDPNSTTERYTLLAADHSTYTFNSDRALVTRSWPNDESWHYTYDNGKLAAVSDDYDRALVFEYYPDTHQDAFMRGKLWRVGDHTASDLDGSTPSGNYVEFDYVESTAVSGAALLASVRDVRSTVSTPLLWHYDYYGQDVGETDSSLFDLMIRRRSPQVDVDGDGVADGEITLEELTYSGHTVELAVDGEMDLDIGWTDVGTVIQNVRIEVDEAYVRYVSVSAENAGIEGKVWHMLPGKSYSITAQVYVLTSGATVTMSVAGDPELPTLNRSTNTTGSWQTLSISNYVPTGVRASKLRFTIPVAGGTEFYVDHVSIQETNLQLTQQRGVYGASAPLLETTYAFASNVGITTEETAGQITTYRFDRGLHSETEDPAGHVTSRSPNNQFRMTRQLDANGHGVSLTWSADGKHLQQVTDALSQTVAFEYNTDDTLDYSLDALGRKTQYVYADVYNPRLPTEIKIIDADGSTVLRWQKFTYDLKGRTLLELTVDPANGATVLQRVERDYYTSGNGNGLLNTVTQKDLDAQHDVITTYFYDSVGRVVQTNHSTTLGGCQKSYSVYDAAGNVVASICNYEPGTNPAPTTVAEAIALYDADYPDQNQVTVTTYDEMARRISVTANAGAGHERTNLTLYDALSRVIGTIQNYQAQGSSAPGDWIWNASASPPRWEDGSGNPIAFGIDNTQNVITHTQYNARGLTRSTRDALGNVTLYGYDAAGRLVKTVQSAATPSHNNDYSGQSPDPDLSAYPENTTSPDEDIVTEQIYDAAGNLITTIAPSGSVTFTVYDVLNRAVKTVRHAKDDATVALNAGDPGYAATADPRSPEYAPSDAPDRDHVDLTVYDAMGRVQAARDTLGHWTLQGYDTLDRQVAVIRQASDPDYEVASNPDLSEYFVVGAADQDLVTKTVYDTAGRVLSNEDVMGVITRHVYDGLGRQVKTIANYVPQGSSEPADWEWVTDHWEDGSSNPVDHGDNDRNIITATQYDSDGRVQWTRDVEGKRQWFVYDALGRRVLAVATCTADPADWVWDEADGRWEDGSGNPIERGDHYDQNVITHTTYDSEGRALLTRDVRGTLTRHVYDSPGRRVRTIANYVPQGSSEPADWVWDETDNRWEDGAGTPISFGVALDQNRISDTAYDLAGRVELTWDEAGIVTRHVYDKLGRRTRTVSNYVPQGSSEPADWVWDETDNRWEDGAGTPISFGVALDQNRIGDTMFDNAGRVVATRDAHGTQTVFGYDMAGRRVTVTQAAGTSLATTSYTCYDRAGRVLRTIHNWRNDASAASPDARDASGGWLFVPTTHGLNNDQDLVTTYQLDRVGRRVRVIDPLGNTTVTAFEKDGQQKWTSDPMGSVTQYRYDQQRRLRRLVQGYLAVQPATHKPICFEANRDGNDEVYVMYADGTGQTNLTNNAAPDLRPMWAPNGQKIAFTSSRVGNWEVYLMDADGANVERLTTFVDTGLTAQGAAWAPDATQLVFSGKVDTRTPHQLYTVNADGSNVRLLYGHATLDATFSAWSPDGQKLAILLGEGSGLGDLYVINSDGTGLTQLTHDASVYNNLMSWSPDGQQLAFAALRGNYARICVMNADGSQLTQLSDVEANDYAPSWSPDGQQLVFYRKASDTDRDIYVMDADGTNQQPLTDTLSSDRWPSWSQYVVDPADWVWVTDHWEDGNNRRIPHGAGWIWDASENPPRWEYEDGTPVPADATRDRNVVVDIAYDRAGRREAVTDPLGHVTVYRYDRLGRRIAHVTNYVPQGSSEPADWIWDTNHWEDGATNNVSHGANGDENAFITKTAYEDLQSGTAYTGQARTIVTKPDGTQTERDFDRLGRAKSIDYNDATTTPAVSFDYDSAGNRRAMTESNGSGPIRITEFAYDAARRLTQVDFDVDGDSTPDEAVSYAYDLNGRRTKLTLPGNLDVTYTYDTRGRLVSLTDWDDHRAEFTYDHANRPVSTVRANGLRSSYGYDAAGRLQLLRHHQGARTLAHFAYRVDGRGNRTQALEALAHPTTTNDTVYDYGDESIVYRGAWTVEGAYKKSEQASASLKLLFLGSSIQFTYGTGVNHALFDVYVDGALWRSFDAYAATSGEQTVALDLQSEGPHVFEQRNRPTHSPAARADQGYDKAVFVLRFKELRVPDFAYDLRSIEYRYDALSRLLEARYNPGLNVAVPDAYLLRRYQYRYDLAGNRLQAIVTVAGSPSTANYTYNGVNQVSNQGFTYDANGNLTGDGVDTYAWDRANRLLSMGDHTYVYDGLGNRISQEVSSIVTQYLLDLQPGLVKVLAAKTGGNTDRYVYEPRGVFAQEDSAGVWSWPLTDGLNSVRSDTSDAVAVNGVQSYAPYGSEVDGSGTFGSPFSFTGEMTDANGLVYLRARYYAPELGVFTGPDPVEFVNRYNYVNGNSANLVDPSGMIWESPGEWDGCYQIDWENCDVFRQAGDLLGVNTQYVWCLERNRQRIYGPANQSVRQKEERRIALREYADELHKCLPVVVQTSPVAYSVGQLVADPTLPSFDAGINDMVNTAACSLDITPNSAVDALAMLIEYGSHQFPGASTLELLSDITFVLFGNDDPRTLMAITGRGTEHTGDYVSVNLNRHVLTYEHSGFHEHFQDYHSQVFHFWPFFNTVAQNPIDGIMIANLADIEHECKEVDMCNGMPEVPCVSGVKVGHVRDARLSTVAVLLGLKARSHSPEQLAQDIRNTLSHPFMGELNPYYYTNQECKWLALEDLNERGLDWPDAYRFYRPYP